MEKKVKVQSLTPASGLKQKLALAEVLTVTEEKEKDPQKKEKKKVRKRSGRRNE